MHIEIGKGLSNTLFGISEKDIINKFGRPDKVYIDEYKDKYLQYYKSQVVYKLESEYNNILGWIEVYNKNAILFGKNFFNMSQKQVIEYITNELNEEPTLDDYSSFESYTFNNNWLELQFTLGKLRNINFGYLFDENDEPIINLT